MCFGCTPNTGGLHTPSSGEAAGFRGGKLERGSVSKRCKGRDSITTNLEAEQNGIYQIFICSFLHYTCCARHMSILNEVSV